MSIFSTIKNATVGGIWKVVAIGLLVGIVASDAYLGYQWHSAASDRDTAVSERLKAEGQRDKALVDNGELRGAIANQNRSILDLATRSTAAQESTAAALSAFAPIKKGLADLAARIASMAPSVTCEQSLAKQRQAIDGLRGAK